MRAKLAQATRKSKKDSKSSVKDTWTFDGRVLVKLANNQIEVVKCHEDLLKYT